MKKATVKENPKGTVGNVTILNTYWEVIFPSGKTSSCQTKEEAETKADYFNRNFDKFNTPQIQELANVTITYAACGGHGKAAANKMRKAELTKAMKEQGKEVPEDFFLYAIGVFNGDGAY